MTIHVSLPKELENRVHQHVESGMYGSASEVVREALRKFFHENEALSASEIAWVKGEIKERLLQAQSDSSSFVDGDDFFEDRIRKLSD